MTDAATRSGAAPSVNDTAARNEREQPVGDLFDGLRRDARHDLAHQPGITAIQT